LAKKREEELPSLIIYLQSSGTQLGIYKDRGPSHEEGSLKLFKEDMAFDYSFQIRKWRKFFGRFTTIVILKFNDSHCLYLA